MKASSFILRVVENPKLTIFIGYVSATEASRKFYAVLKANGNFQIIRWTTTKESATTDGVGKAKFVI